MKSRNHYSPLTVVMWLIVFVVIMIVGVGSALANGYPPPVTPPAASPVDIDATLKQQQQAQAAAKSAAEAAAKAAALANGGSSDAEGGDAKSYSASGDVLNQHSSRVLVFPAPVWTQVPQATGCFVTESHAGSAGWNFVSGSKSIQFSEPICVSIRMAESARLMCHFKTAEFIDQNTFKTMFPSADPLPTTPGIRNLSLEECEAIKRPRLVTTHVMAPPAVIAPPVPAVVPAPVIKPPVKRKQAAPKKKPVPCAMQKVERNICVPAK